MFINIITPCCRPENLHKISKSINIPSDNYRWLVVFDLDEMPNQELIPSNCEPYVYRDKNSISGNAQRNFAIDKVQKGHIYFNDDDTLLHKDLWESIKGRNDDFITFAQDWPDGNLRLDGKYIGVNFTDSHNFIVKHSIVKDTRWMLNIYAADGIFAYETASKTKNIAFIPRVLSTYNVLR